LITKDQLIKDLHTLGIDECGILKVHISYKAIGDVEGGAQTVIDALTQYMKNGLLVLPTHTWRNVNKENPVMDILYTPSCVGITTELFRKNPHVFRSQHPTHSVAAIGEDAENFVSGESLLQTPAGIGGVYHKLWERDAQILLIGVNFSRNTFIHGIEEWDGASDTISKTRENFYVIAQDGKRIYTPQYRHCARIGSETFTKLEPMAINKNILKLGTFGGATTRLMKARPLRAMVAPLIKENSHYLTNY